uniref:General vesicular transport factor p115 n=1 Tax=Cacopsylla melanoneura TaxID=428564 RepID=A0A8D9B0J5_9HEMI
MDYFRNGLKSVLGTPPPGEQPSGAETIERLVERLRSSTLLDDRRDACRALKAMSRKYRVEVGAQGMDPICHILENDRADAEIVGYALDTLCNIVDPEIFPEEELPEGTSHRDINVGEQFTEIFIKNQENVALVLGYLEEFDFRVRWSAVKFLNVLLLNRRKNIQDIVLVSPMGVSKLMDLLGDSREIIRNDALLLLISLTQANANIQKIVAFEMAFDRLFDVISEEGHADGGIVVEDCLRLMLNLLKNNISNQNFFKEGSYIQKLAQMFHLPESGPNEGWSAQREANILSLLQVIRSLVTPGNPAQVVSSCQKVLHASGILGSLCTLLMTSGVPVGILTETINTVAEIIRGNHPNQEFFAMVNVSSDPPRQAIVVLLMSMVNQKQSYPLRCSVLYCFLCYLYRNEMNQAKLIATLLPSATSVPSLTAGQLLCSGLFSSDSLSNWFCCVGLAHGLADNPAQKESLLKVLLSPRSGEPPVSLLRQSFLLLQQSIKVHSKLGVLMLLATWLSHCPLAVQHFLNIPDTVPYLIAQAATIEHDENQELMHGLCAFVLGICVIFNDDSVPNLTKESLAQLILKRIGVDMFLDKLSDVSRHELYSRAAKRPQLDCDNVHEPVLDYEFCKLYKALEGPVSRCIAEKSGTQNGGVVYSDSSLEQYTALISAQNKEMGELKARQEALQEENRQYRDKVDQLEHQARQLHEHNIVLRSQMNSGNNVPSENNSNAAHPPPPPPPDNRDIMIRSLENEVQNLRLQVAHSVKNNAEVDMLRMQLYESEMKRKDLDESLERLQNDQDDLLEMLDSREQKLLIYRNRLIQLGQRVDEEDGDMNGVGNVS